MFESLKNIFAKKKPEFSSLKESPNKDKYFYRVATWTWHSEEEITIIDPNAPRVITLDPWPQLVFLDAKGKLTVTEYVYYMASRYSFKIPENLDKEILFNLDTLFQEKLIAFSDTPVTLDASIENPKNQKL
jgi:hypothetical protein